MSYYVKTEWGILVVMDEEPFSKQDFDVPANAQEMHLEVRSWIPAVIEQAIHLCRLATRLKIVAKRRIPKDAWAVIAGRKHVVFTGQCDLRDKNFSEFRNLERLEVSFERATPEQLHQLQGCQSLVVDACSNMASFDPSRIPGLRSLEFSQLPSGSEPIDWGMDFLEEFTLREYRGKRFALPSEAPALRSLTVLAAKITPVTPFPILPVIRKLDLMIPGQQPSYKNLGDCKELEELSIESRQGFPGVESVARCPRLTSLYLRGSPLPPDGGVWLQQLKRLKSLWYYPSKNSNPPQTEVYRTLGLDEQGRLIRLMGSH